jgi:superfamily II DNA or RNA helicase
MAYRLLPHANGGATGKGDPMGRLDAMGQFPMPYILKCTDKLLPYQPRAVAHLCSSIVSNGSAADGSDCGIGKTYHAIAVCRELSLVPAIVCSFPGIPTWNRVCQFFGINPLFVMNWESAKNGKFRFAPRTVGATESVALTYDYEWRLPHNTLLIFDECHVAAVETSQNNALWRACKGRAALSLSATFADRPSRLKTLLSILGAVKPDEFDRWLLSRGHFVNQYDEIESLDPVDDMKAIHRILYPRYGFRLSDDDPAVRKFFPEARYQVEICNIGRREMERQNELYAELLAKVEHYRSLGQQAQVLAADTRYRQAAELLKVKALVDLAVSYRMEGRAVCIFVNFRETLTALARLLKTRSLIFGNQEKYGMDREEVKNDFQSGRTDLIVSTIGAGGQSIDLHDVSGKRPRLSLVCPTYDPIRLEQVFGRTHRSGSKSIPIIKLVYASGTIEEKVALNVNSKLNNIHALNDGDLMEPDLFNIVLSKERTYEN